MIGGTMTTNVNEMSLDEQCARAMGWRNYVERQFLAGARTVTTGPLYDDSPPRYSTDSALLDAKLEWLCDRARFRNVDINLAEGVCAASVFHRHIQGVECTIEIHGSNIHEATARLVVAVAERLKERT